ncbi:phosphomannomutase/phosphoglucomutase, partial [bacterium LRH843]|nr:phosphomannomutase/phosphoglucomutase [bacterium LRH843]
DEKGVIISADRLLSLFAHMCLADHPAHEVVFDVKCSTMVRNTVLAHHGIPKMIRTGSSFLRKYLAQSEGHAVFGGEYAEHYVFNDGRGFR